MNDFNLLISNAQQISLGILACIYIWIYVFQDSFNEIDNTDLKFKKYSSLLYLSIGFGLFIIFLNDWGLSRVFFCVEFSLIIVLGMIKPKYAVGFFIYLLLSRPWETFDGQLMASMPRDISYLVMLSILFQKIIKKQFYFRFNIGTFLLLCFSFWLFISGSISNHSSLAVSMFMEVFSKAVILFILIQNSINTSSDAFPIKAALVLSILEKGFISVMKSSLESSTISEGSQRLESVGILGNSNDIAAIFVLVTPLLIFFFYKLKIRPINYLLSVCSLMIMTFLIWETQSRGAVLALFISLASFLLLKIKNIKIIIIICMFSLLGGYGAMKLLDRDSSDVEGSTSNRIIFWKAGANMAIRNPVFGVGFWGFPINFQGYALDGDTGTEGKEMTAHSSWVLVVAEGGFMALFLFMGLWIYCFYRAWLLRDLEPEYFMSLVGYGIAITFLSHTYLLFPYILLSLIMSHSHADDLYSRNGYLSWKV